MSEEIKDWEDFQTQFLGVGFSIYDEKLITRLGVLISNDNHKAKQWIKDMQAKSNIQTNTYAHGQIFGISGSYGGEKNAPNHRTVKK